MATNDRYASFSKNNNKEPNNSLPPLLCDSFNIFTIKPSVLFKMYLIYFQQLEPTK